MKRISGLPKFKRQLRKIHGWFIRNDRLKDQVHDFSRQLQEAWDDKDDAISCFHQMDEIAHQLIERNKTIIDHLRRAFRERDESLDKAEHWKSIAHELDDMHECAIEQLHRVARERDEERRLKMDAEDMLLDSYLRIHERDKDYNEEE